MLIGAHVSTRGGLPNAVARAAAIGADVFQTHPTSAQMWRPLHLDSATRDRYHTLYRGHGMRGHWMHAVYLVNLATRQEALLRRSMASLLHYMELAATLDADGVVLHAGSHLGAGFAATAGQVAAALREVIDRAPPSRARLLVENSAGSGGCVGSSLGELGAIVATVDRDRLGVCLDTQHLFASGYDLRDPEHLAATLEGFAAEVGFDRLHLVHANDSRVPLGCNVDRHANLGEGEIGLEAFRLMLADPRLRAVPWILEVPGVERRGADREQVNRLRACAGLAPAARGDAA